MTNSLRLLGPKTLLYTAFWAFLMLKVACKSTASDVTAWGLRFPRVGVGSSLGFQPEFGSTVSGILCSRFSTVDDRNPALPYKDPKLWE